MRSQVLVSKISFSLLALSLASCNSADIASSIAGASSDVDGTGNGSGTDPTGNPGGSGGSSPGAGSTRTKRYICDPFQTAEGGQPQLVGSIYAAPSPTLENVGSYLFDFGTLEKFFFKTADGIEPYVVDDVVLRLSSINVLPRTFSQGFPIAGTGATPELLKVPMTNEDLVEWFALKMRGKMKLGANDEAGYYQLAIISDDGARLKFEEDISDWIVENSIHPPIMTCASNVKYFDQTTSLSFDYEYFQGPRFEIASTLVWRKIENPAAAWPNAEACARDPITGSAPYILPVADRTFYDPALAVEGWKILGSDNFELPDDVGELPPCN